ncbi:hypothetical protein EQH57_0486 [Dictyocoela roeselum]|nr:hypothetical protein EQH57_0486 [Dictyocoela roeselum]
MYKEKSVFELKRIIETRLNHTYHRILKASSYEIIYKYSAIDLIKRKYKKGKPAINEKRMHIQNNKMMNERKKNHKYNVGDKVFKKTHHTDIINDIYLGLFEIVEVKIKM